MIALNTCSLIRENKYRHRFYDGNNEYVNFYVRKSLMYTIHSLHHSPHSHLTHSLLTNLNFPLTSHLTISPLWFSLSPHHLTLSLKSLSPLSPSYLPTLSPHSLLLSSTSLSLISTPLSHTHTLSLSSHSQTLPHSPT